MPSQQQNPASAANEAARIWRAATADADGIAARMQPAARAAAAERFGQWWPANAVSTPTRKLLQNWYLHAFEHQLTLGISAPADSPIDGVEAEKVMAGVRMRTRAPAELVVDTVVGLARDARDFAEATAEGRKHLVDLALAGRISQVFPRSPGVEIGMRQAIAEQWYVRCFRAAIEPALYRLPTTPVTPPEISAVGVSIATAQPRRLYDRGEPIGPANSRAWQDHCIEQWDALKPTERATWLQQHGFSTGMATLSYADVPSLVQTDFLRDHPPTELILSHEPTTGQPVVAAARAFGTEPIGAATATQIDASRYLFHSAGVSVPDKLIKAPDPQPVATLLNSLHRANRRSAEMRGHQDQGWWTEDDKLARATKLRADGKPFAEIARAIGITTDQAMGGLDDLVGVEGLPLAGTDMESRVNDPADWDVLLDAARAIERVPELMGLSPHLVATATKVQQRPQTLKRATT